ncbi:hypothetical protein DL764_000906 [Monosporascus ibericus]|uniref:Peroxidase n=1 Tax=Monosporascus ibericus TaxID=155417 RepID=A0A4Q4TTD8_9PEZI|nr:hypothetical protein DL764_000906 [Monosporascus ibericus]
MSSRRLLSGADRNRGRLSAASSSRAHREQVAELPAYEPPSFPLDAKARKALAELSTNRDTEKYAEHIEKSLRLLSDSVRDINDRYTERKNYIKGRQQKRGEGTQKTDRDRAEEKAALALKEDVPQLTEECESAVRRVIDLQIELEDGKTALRETIHRAESEDAHAAQNDEDDEMADGSQPQVTGAWRTLQEEKKKMADDYAAKTMYERYALNNDYIGFKRLAHDAIYGTDGKPLPDPSRWFTQNGGQADEDDDEDLVIAEESVSINCPLSMRVMEDPYTCNKCKHTFDKASLHSFFGGRRVIKNCPQTGCRVEGLTLDDFSPDPIMLRKIKRARTDQVKADVDDEDEEDNGLVSSIREKITLNTLWHRIVYAAAQQHASHDPKHKTKTMSNVERIQSQNIIFSSGYPHTETGSTRSRAKMAQDTPSAPSAAQLEEVKAAVRELLHQPDYDDGSAGPVLVRLAWHSAGTYCKETDTGGSNGAGMRYEKEGGDPANAGLADARAFLESVKRRFPWITYADLWTLAAVVAIREMGGPEVAWHGGRTDFMDDSRVPPRGRLPDGAQGADHLRHIFYRMGFDDREIVALSGAHNLGRCHADRSGFHGKWVNNPTRFSNQYFRLLLANDWKRKKLPNGVEQFVHIDEDSVLEDGGDKPEELMMLPTDMSLLSDPAFRPWVERYARDKDLFFEHFAAAFAKLLELGIRRDSAGRVVNDENVEGGYRSAPKKADEPQAPRGGQNPGQVGHETALLKQQNERFRGREAGAKL